MSSVDWQREGRKNAIPATHSPSCRYYLHGGGFICLSDVESVNVEIKKLLRMAQNSCGSSCAGS